MSRIAVAFLVVVCVVADPLSSFLPPQASTVAVGGEIGAPFETASLSACAAACLSNSSCISFNWGSISTVFGSCGIVHECYPGNSSSCPSNLNLDCPGGTFTGVSFASFGTPIVGSGSCSYSLGSCDASESVAVVAAACVGKSSCSIPAISSNFGGDPCSGVVKFLAASLTGSNCAPPPPPGSPMCQLSGYSRVYNVVSGGAAPNASYYQRLQPRNDTRLSGPAVSYPLVVPTSGVVFNGGVLQAAFETNIQYLLGTYTVDNLLWNFRKRAGVPQPPGARCIGWDCRANWIEGSLAGAFLMGAGGTLRWMEHPVLRSMMDELIEGIANCSEPDGYLAAFAQSALATDEHPDYTTSWTVHGFLEAAIAGNAAALGMIRAHMDVFNNHTLLPTFLPPDGGNWPYQVPEGPWPPGADNSSRSGSGSETGHTIYLIMQGIIHSTRLALSPVGTQADIDLVQRLYQEPWWLEMLAAGDPVAIWRKLFFSHNYELTAIEAYADMYELTGNTDYLNAVLSAWQMFRDPELGWIHVGGSLAINEGAIYTPGSFHLEAGSASVSELRKRDWFRAERAAIARRQAHHQHHQHDEQHEDGEHEINVSGRSLQNDWNSFPTGEFCGAVFWLKLNQRFHRMDPDNVTFVDEIEREMFNEGLTHQGVNGSGIRYFSNLNGQKENPGNIGTCCEGQGTRLYGSLHEYLFSTIPSVNAVLVDIYAPSSFVTTVAGTAVNLTVSTEFPYGSDVSILVSAPTATPFDLRLRMPSWVDAAAVSVTLNGQPVANEGEPGTYLSLSRTWGSSDQVSFSLPMGLVAHLYTGVTQIAPFTRYAYTFGPVLLAATGTPAMWDASINSLRIPGVNGSNPAAWLEPANDGNALHFTVAALPGLLFQPNWEIQTLQANFSAYPCFDA